MKWLYGFCSLALAAALGGCSEEGDPLPDAPATKLNPSVYVVDQGVPTKYDPNDLGSTYWQVGDECGFLLLDNTTHALYTDTKGHIRYRWDGVYWSTEEGYSMNEKYVDVYCFYPFLTTQSATPDGLWPDSWLPVETASNTDYLWGRMIDHFKDKVNGPNPDVSMEMFHVLARVSFKIKRVLWYDENNNIGKGNVSAFSVTTKQSANSNSLRGAFKYSFITGTPDYSTMVYDTNPVEFNTIIGASLPSATGSTIGETTEFMSVIPVSGILTVDLTIDGQSYTVTLDPVNFQAGYHYVVNLEYTGTEIKFPDATGAPGSKLEIVPWTSAGAIGVKSMIDN